MILLFTLLREIGSTCKICQRIVGANGREVIKVPWEHMVRELLSGKIHEEVTHAWLTLRTLYNGIQAPSMLKLIYTITRCKIVFKA